MTSHLVRIEFCRSTRGCISESLVSQGVQGILGPFETVSPPLLGCQLSLQPIRDAILLIRGEGRDLGKNAAQGPGHFERIRSEGLPNKPWQTDRAAARALGYNREANSAASLPLNGNTLDGQTLMEARWNGSR